MAKSNKRYYWLKLHPDFFKRREVKLLRKIAGGDTFTIIYLKMLLFALPSDGLIFYEGVDKTIEDEIALELDEDIDNVRVTVRYLFEKGLIKEVSEAEFLLVQARELCGGETDGARRMRKSRAIEKERNFNALLLQSDAEASRCDTDVQKSDKNVTTEKEKEKEKDIYSPVSSPPGNGVIDEVLSGDSETGETLLEKKPAKTSNKNIPKECFEIIDYLNEKAGTKYRVTTVATGRHINARLSEGYTVADFKKVIDTKCAEWLGTEYAKYLRPDTLFAGKFEGYVNTPGAMSDEERRKSREFETRNMA